MLTVLRKKKKIGCSVEKDRCAIGYYTLRQVPLPLRNFSDAILYGRSWIRCGRRRWPNIGALRTPEWPLFIVHFSFCLPRAVCEWELRLFTDTVEGRKRDRGLKGGGG